MKLFITFLLMPVLALIMVAIAWGISRKNKLLGNKAFIFYVLLAAVILAIPALAGFFIYWFMPYCYIALQALYLFLGALNLKYMDKINVTGHSYILQFLLMATIMILGMALFSVVFNLCNELEYGVMASTCILPFLFFSLYRQMYRAYDAIPLEIYHVWEYLENAHTEQSKLDADNLMVVDINLFKDKNDTDLLHITAKTSENMYFGEWFKIFLTDYNKKSPDTPICYMDKESPYGWIFYIKTSFFRRRKYIDPDLTFKENGIKAHAAIIAHRVKDNITKESNKLI
ncbi:TssN family type VI secretion system protein [Bacteroides congonensis]